MTNIVDNNKLRDMRGHIAEADYGLRQALHIVKRSPGEWPPVVAMLITIAYACTRQLDKLVPEPLQEPPEQATAPSVLWREKEETWMR